MSPADLDSIKNSEFEHKLNAQRNKEVLHDFNTFLHKEATGGILLLICAIFAIFFTTLDFEWYKNIWNTEIGINIGQFSLELTFREWINDALMAVFFFVVGLEIKREMLVGQLSSVKRSILPIMAAVGGMLFPALIFTAFNLGHPESSNGWGIPTATDIAFAIGIISLLGKRVPVGLKIFLTALAIVDDLGAIIILAIFYPSHTLHLDYLAYVGIILMILFIFNRARFRNKYLYIIPGVFMWYFTLVSGIHATISGVLLAMAIPSKGTINEVRFESKIHFLLNKFRLSSNSQLQVLANPEQQHVIHSMSNEIQCFDPLLHQLESKFHGIVRFLIMPLFALANAGVALNFDSFSNGIPPVAMGIFFGLLIGKPVGIFLFSYLSIKLKIAVKPRDIQMRQIAAVGVLGGIGFTMSIFVNSLSFDNPLLTDIGKISILITTITAALLGIVALLLTCKDTTHVPAFNNIIPRKKIKIN